MRRWTAARIVGATMIALTILPIASAAASDVVPFSLTFPVEGGSHYTDTFGAPRSHGGHEGQDLFAAKGTPVLAAHSGTIHMVNFSRDPANLQPERCCSLIIRHPDGWETWYLHLNNDSPGTDDGSAWGIADGIVPGVSVTAGQLVGWVGDSGNAENTPSHLHFELHTPSDVVVNAYGALVQAELTTPTSALLRLGDSGNAVGAIQRALDLAGFDIGYIDGDFGEVTKTAVVELQTFLGLAPDGIVGPQTRAALVVAATPSNLVLRETDRGPAVAGLQTQLSAAGYDPGPLDGIFGPKTLLAVMAFQTDSGLTVDGIVGAQTRTALLNQ